MRDKREMTRYLYENVIMFTRFHHGSGQYKPRDPTIWYQRLGIWVTFLRFGLWVMIHGSCDVMHDIKDILGHGL